MALNPAVAVSPSVGLDLDLSLNLDANVTPATYTLAVIVHDKVSGEMTELRESFEVQ